MNQQIFRSYNEIKRKNLSWAERWEGTDNGLIICWEVGRELRDKKPELAISAKNGELPVLVWKGGVEKKIKKNEKFGTLYYLAQWQGLRGEDLNIDYSKEYTITCSKTGTVVTYTSEPDKYNKP